MKQVLGALWPRLIAAAILMACLEVVRALSGASLRLDGLLIRWLFVTSVLEVALWTRCIESRQRSVMWFFPWSFLALALLCSALGLAYALTQRSAVAWAFSAALCALLVALSGLGSQWRWGARLLGGLLFALAGGAVLIIVDQVESRFAQEEFFAALQAVALGGLLCLMIVLRFWLARRLGVRSVMPDQRPRGVRVRRWMAGLVILFPVIGGLGLTLHAYQRSFYPLQAPVYPGISRESPFVCGSSKPDPQTPQGDRVLHQLVAQTEATADEVAPVYGLLAAASGEREWAQAFRRTLLEDVREARYVGPAQSIKFSQYSAAARIYYYTRVSELYPDLFSQVEKDNIGAWIAAVNRRALTVEWVDWMYATAFSDWPRGPYENQEIGVGLLALLESQGLADADLSALNRSYLASRQRGWFARFRNTDDAYAYQPLWIVNALFQDLYWQQEGNSDPEALRNRALAFEWLLLQALPDGAPLSYNYPDRLSLAPAAYLGARLLDDPRYVWWSARMLDWAQQESLPLNAFPGAEYRTSLTGRSPDVGSCLMYGDSGLPTEQGPLAPDKIVFRDGWAPDSQYLLLNLRFSGWHRYKATNTVTLLYKEGPLVADENVGQPVSWLPVGRSLFRDKRIPRENLSGVLVPRTGIAAVLYALTGIGGPWAQDPPHYARVEQFEVLGPLDVSRTAIDEWRGWRHERAIYFVPGGPILVVDQAAGWTGDGSAALEWQLVGEARREGGSLWFGQDEQSGRLVWPLEVWESVQISGQPATIDDSARSRALYHSGEPGRLDLATLFVLGDWADGHAQVSELRSPSLGRVLGYRVFASRNGGTLDLLHNGSGEWLEADELATDGGAVMVWRDVSRETVVCALGGNARVALPEPPVQLSVGETEVYLPDEMWDWSEGMLTLRNLEDAVCVGIR